jgi:folylpolyglutamate synthase
MKDAIDALNKLQTSFPVLEERRKAGIKPDENSNREMLALLKRIGYSVSPLIHDTTRPH